MKKIAYIIGHRNSEDPDRLRNLLIVLKWLIGVKVLLLKHKIELKIIVVEQDETPKLKGIDNKDITHIFLYNPGLYNRGWAFNVGFRFTSADYYFFADNDIVLKTDDIIKVFLKCFKYDAVNPYKKILDTNDDFVKTFDPERSDGIDKTFLERQNTCFAGGIVGLSNKSVNIVNGWDERFRGRGWEDFAFTAKIKLFLYSLHTFRFIALHLWHLPESHTDKKNNFLLNKEYQNYSVRDYIEQIEKSCKFGSALKYSIFGEKKKIQYCKFDKYERIKHANRLYDKLYKCARKKHKFVKCTKKEYIFACLCGQLCNIDLCDSGLPESGECHCRKIICDISLSSSSSSY
jgi:glycosyltransferase involved in cell wall biosynthesis